MNSNNLTKSYWYTPFIKTIINYIYKQDLLFGFIPIKKDFIDYSFNVDMVYLWVDGDDPKWLAKKQYWQGQKNQNLDEQAITKGRFVNNDELKFALRSVEKNIPWINKIYIITDNQIPEWLNTNNEKIKVVFHNEFIPKENLPLFNSEAIESFLADIPELSEHFLYGCDDMYIAKPLDKSFFFMPDGKPIIRLKKNVYKRNTKKSMYTRSIFMLQKMVLKHFKKHIPFAPQHNIDAYTKSAYKECIKYFEKEFEQTKQHKFRQEGDIQRVIVAYYMIVKNLGKFKYCTYVDTFLSVFEQLIRYITKRYCADSITINMNNKNPYARLKKTNPALFCTNDGEGVTDFDRARTRIFLEETFPEKSSYET